MLLSRFVEKSKAHPILAMSGAPSYGHNISKNPQKVKAVRAAAFAKSLPSSIAAALR
jgi:hypothetical protein